MTDRMAAMGETFTRGPVTVGRATKPDNTGGYDWAIADQDNQIIAEAFEHTGYAGGTVRQYIIQPAAANAALIAEAFNVATETGKTPRQLALALEHAAAREAKLREALAVAHDNLNMVGRHFDSCPMYPSCTCGLNEAQEIARAALAGEPK